MVVATVAMAAALALAPHVGVYPVFLMKALCFALFACAFNLLIGFGGLLSFGHAMFLGTAGYVSAHAAKVWGVSPELARPWLEINARTRESGKGQSLELICIHGQKWPPAVDTG